MIIKHFDELDSTNDTASELLLDCDQVIVSTNNQKKGRGRRDKVWLGNPNENLYLSFGIKHNVIKNTLELSSYQAMGCLAVIHTLRELTNSDFFRLKYPNDVMAREAERFNKISGILVEHSFMGNKIRNTIIGIGINVNQVDFPEGINSIATSLKKIGFSLSTNEVKDKLISQLKNYSIYSALSIFEEWQKELKIVGKTIKINDKSESYLAKELLHDGRLIAADNTGNEIIIDNGDSIRYEIT